MNDIIEFKGDLFGKTRKFAINRFKKTMFIIALGIALAFTILTIVVAMHSNVAIAWFSISYFALPILVLFSMSKTDQKANLPIRVFVDKLDECVVIQSETQENFHMLDKVKRVVDYGEFYDFEFYFPDKDKFAICQKSLLTTGTLEEFEEIFSDKFVRK